MLEQKDTVRSLFAAASRLAGIERHLLQEVLPAVHHGVAHFLHYGNPLNVQPNTDLLLESVLVVERRPGCRERLPALLAQAWRRGRIGLTNEAGEQILKRGLQRSFVRIHEDR